MQSEPIMKDDWKRKESMVNPTRNYYMMMLDYLFILMKILFEVDAKDFQLDRAPSMYYQDLRLNGLQRMSVARSAINM